MIISPEAINIARAVTSGWMSPERDAAYRDAQKAAQLAINSATKSAIQSAKDSAANFRKSEVKRIEAERECDRLRGEVEKAYREGQISTLEGVLEKDLSTRELWNSSHAKRVAEGKE